MSAHKETIRLADPANNWYATVEVTENTISVGVPGHGFFKDSGKRDLNNTVRVFERV